VGCATPYQQSGYRGGFTETRLAPDIFAISFAGNSFTSPERVSDFALLRAAELTLNNGYNRFTLLNVARRTLDFLLPAFRQPAAGLFRRVAVQEAATAPLAEGGGGTSP
jgi:hypothetical protein